MLCTAAFFEEYPLRTAKAGDFAGFSAVVCLMTEGAHLRMDGLRRTAHIAETTNSRRPSWFVESSETIRQPSLLDG